MDNPKTQAEKVLWQQVWGLAVLQTAVGLSWQIYGAAQPAILTKFDLLTVAGALALVPGLVSLSIEPLFGKFSDRMKQRLGSRLPALNVGVLLTALIFLTVAFSLQTTWINSVRWLIPALMVGWVTTMKIFQNPSLALVKQYTPPKDLPQAAAILTIVGAFTGAAKPFAQTLVARWGASLTFTLGGAVLLTALTVLHRLKPKTSRTATESSTPDLSAPQLALLFGAGAGVQLALGALLAALPTRLQSQLPQVGTEMIASSLLLVSGIAAWPLGLWMKRVGAERTLWAGLGGAVLVALLALWEGGVALALIGILVGGAVLAILFNIGVPLALARAPTTQASFAIGLFFSGGALATIFFAVYKLLYGDLSIALATGLTVAGLMVAGACVQRTHRASVASELKAAQQN